LTGILFSLNSSASEPAKDYPEHTKQVKQILEEWVKFPGCAMQRITRGEATVIFSISDKGLIQIKELSANCKSLENNIREQLTGLYFIGVYAPSDQLYRVKFTFLFC
jgi:hypothetical protein